jgi:tRNA-dihydrouridine synthase
MSQEDHGKEEMLRLLNKAIQHVCDLSALKAEIESKQAGPWEKLMNTVRRHIQGLLKVRPDMERERDNLLAEMNTERNRGEAGERH